ncbi:DUF4157 domain-containing protein [Aquabacterium sp. A7-Y]|uniref:eCIS core domain-containing protein n=1 Tax=Aquabacterium sp. A7-Y TaxID=1349605 RepID=UPI00223D9B86|nr:DUF4157 domain-containing protein [Aquabacterium sp. A7-Y]MCW7541380.1 DUF4157 domain-containing protein [Aquabacterium sp. A7-Y]
MAPEAVHSAFRGGSSAAGVQRAPLRVSSPEDASEREATTAARAVMTMSAPSLSRAVPGIIHRSSARSGSAAVLPGGPAGGQPLPARVRRFMEPRFGADFGSVRVHADAQAALASRNLGARAFATGNRIFFGSGQYQPDTLAGQELIAHELAHTVQQGAAPRAAVQRSADLTLTPQPAGSIQRLGLSDILDGLAELAANVPGFTLLTLIIGRNPINMRAVDRSFVNVLRALMGLIPGGEILFQVLERYGIMTRLGHWVVGQTSALGLSFQAVRDAFTRFTDSLSWRDIFHPGDVWRRARRIFTPLIDRIGTLVDRLVTQAITWLKETFLAPLASFCRQIRGYELVTVMLGRDPFTGAPVPRTALTVVRAFAGFIPGGTEKVDQLVQSGALERAYAWFTLETQTRNLTWSRVSGTFAAAWASLQIDDVLHPIATLQRIVGLFRPLLADLVGFAGVALLKLLELIFEAAMGAGGRRVLTILSRVRGTFVTIIHDPVGFLRNLLGAVGRGVRQFMTHILAHLRTGVIAWLTGPVARAGVQMPERWDLRGIVWFVLQVLGITWPRVREKLVRLMGERPVAALEAGFQLVQEVRQRGLVQALRERVSEFFGGLQETALGAIRGFIQRRLVVAGITQLLSMLNPVGAIIQAIIKTYTTIQFFIQRINQILDLVESIVNSIAAIASGAIGAAANFVEHTMARTIPVILDFLARFIGLGDVGAHIQRTIRELQASVDRMLDRAVDWIRNQARNLASRLLGGDPSVPQQQRLQNGVREGTQAVNRLSGTWIGLAVIRPVLAAIRLRHNLQRLDAEPRDGRWAVVGVVNPTLAELSTKLVDTTTIGALQRTYDPVNVSRFGTVATVVSLSQIGSPRPPTAEGNAIWNRLRRRMLSAGGEYYVRGHLINGTFGGPGNDWRNLTPLTQRANNSSIASMLRTFERPVRDAVRSGAVVTIRVEAGYRPAGRAAVVAALRAGTTTIPGRSAAQHNAIADVIEAEEAVPAEVVATGTVRRGTSTTPLPPSRTQNAIDTDLARYFLVAAPGSSAVKAPATRRVVNLSTANAATMATLAGMDTVKAAQVIAARPASGFVDRDDFVAKMDHAGLPGASLLHSMVSTANVRIIYR